MAISRDEVELRFGDEHQAAELHYGQTEWQLNTSRAGKLTVTLEKLGGKKLLRIEGDGASPEPLTGTSTSLDGKAAIEFDFPSVSNAQLRW